MLDFNSSDDATITTRFDAPSGAMFIKLTKGAVSADVAYFTTDGRLGLPASLPPELGLQLDANGRIVLA